MVAAELDIRASPRISPLPLRAEAALLPGRTLWRLDGVDPEEKNHAVRCELQLPRSLEVKALAALLARVLNPLFFEELRTKQQLGYIVQAQAQCERNGFLALRLVVQSERSAEYVASRVQEWTAGAWDLLENDISEAAFEEYRAALVSRLRERPKSLIEEFGRHFGEVAARTLDFSHREQQAKHLETNVSLEDLRRFSREKFRKAPGTIVLISAEGTEASSEDVPSAPVRADRRLSPEDVAAFRRSAEWRLRDSIIARDSQASKL
eukprot:gnl/TRDRNA2_/TRDRNA2_169261_c3_seq4.p1 gnl/TRDRNA2_/TRDRNA2_169261_c3~~gnl/TRDRNA2_/TRDRNA2_169261_c3_seq4.p1  ORF type:complete len:300 (+),score=66.30 gnl/TRDRNA2_/TRDRNA2_169261_c3_seq4:108-902(+)